MKAGKKIISVMASLMTLSGLSPLAVLAEGETIAPSSVEEWIQAEDDISDTSSQETEAQENIDQTESDQDQADSAQEEQSVNEGNGTSEEGPVGDQIMDQVMQSDKIYNQALLEAYQDYQTIVSQFDFKDAYDGPEEGTPQEEFDANFSTSLEPEVTNMSDTETTYSYVFQSQGDQGTDSAELFVYFYQGQLIYVGVASLESSLPLGAEDLVSNEQIEAWFSEDPFPYLKDMADQMPRVMGVSHMVYDQQALDLLLLPSGDSLDQASVDFMGFLDGQALDSMPVPYEEAFNQPHGHLLSFSVLMIKHSILGEPFPQASEVQGEAPEGQPVESSETE